MRYVQITVDGVTYTLRETANGSWTVTNRAPQVAGEYPIAVIVTTETGQRVEVDVEDPELLNALRLIVTEDITVSGERMRNYYPMAIQRILEFQALIRSEGFEVDFLKNDIELSVNEAYLITMGESRITQWEKALGIIPSASDTLEDRREVIIARVRGQGKLNTALINSIVSTFTNGTATSYIRDSVLYVEIKPPQGNKQFKFDNVVQALSTKIPAHLGLSVSRDYATWGEVKQNFADWNAVNQLETWDDLVAYIPPQ